MASGGHPASTSSHLQCRPSSRRKRGAHRQAAALPPLHPARCIHANRSTKGDKGPRGPYQRNPTSGRCSRPNKRGAADVSTDEGKGESARRWHLACAADLPEFSSNGVDGKARLSSSEGDGRGLCLKNSPASEVLSPLSHSLTRTAAAEEDWRLTTARFQWGARLWQLNERRRRITADVASPRSLASGPSRGGRRHFILGALPAGGLRTAPLSRAAARDGKRKAFQPTQKGNNNICLFRRRWPLRNDASDDPDLPALLGEKRPGQ